MLQRPPELSRITADLEAYWPGGLLDEVARRDCKPEEARQVLRHTWYRSLLTVFHSDSPCSPRSAVLSKMPRRQHTEKFMPDHETVSLC